MSKIIIGIHGLGNKPPFAVMEQWWLQSILDGFQAVHYPSSWLKFELVYWANFIHNQPLDPTEADTNSPLYLEDPYSQTGIIQRGQREPLQKKIKDYLEKQAMHNAKAKADRAKKVSDNAAKELDAHVNKDAPNVPHAQTHLIAESNAVAKLIVRIDAAIAKDSKVTKLQMVQILTDVKDVFPVPAMH